MEKEDLFTLYMEKNIDALHNIYKDVEFISREIPNPTINYIKDALEELEKRMQMQLKNTKKKFQALRQGELFLFVCKIFIDITSATSCKNIYNYNFTID